MNTYLKYISLLSFVLFSTFVLAQNNGGLNIQGERFTVRGSVIESDTRNPIPDVNIEVNGGGYATTDIMGDFRIEVRIGDELTIRYKDFETVYYTIKSNERIEVQVETNKKERTLSKYSKRLRSNPESFKSLIDSADVYLKKDARKSIQFISEALVETNSAKENGIAYESLGDIYFYWKQYDLAVSNYRISSKAPTVTKCL